MYLIICFVVVFNVDFCHCGGEDIADSVIDDAVVRGVAEDLVTVLRGRAPKNARLLELRNKLARIDSYIIDRDAYGNLLLHHAKNTKLNATNFYNALVSRDSYNTSSNKSKNLYWKLKKRLTKDDLLRILKARCKIKVSSRRVVDTNLLNDKHNDSRLLDKVVDKYLSESRSDNHKYNASKANSMYWDPQIELKDRLASQSGRRIFGGERTLIMHYPFMVSIHLMGRFWCGGALYWNDLVITSASCLQLLHNNRMFRENPKVLAVRLGSNHSRVGGEIISAVEVFFHPAYEPKTLKNNIALLRLARQVHITYHRNPKLIALDKTIEGMPTTALVMLLGWGVSKITQKLSYEPFYLQKKILPVFPNKFCQEIYGEKFVTRTMFCAGTMSTGEGACSHDAGGPAVMNGLLVGIISYGPSICGFPEAPTVITLIGAYADWIDKVNKSMPAYYRGRMRTTTSTQDPFGYLAVSGSGEGHLFNAHALQNIQLPNTYQLRPEHKKLPDSQKVNEMHIHEIDETTPNDINLPESQNQNQININEININDIDEITPDHNNSPENEKVNEIHVNDREETTPYYDNKSQESEKVNKNNLNDILEKMPYEPPQPPPPELQQQDTELSDNVDDDDDLNTMKHRANVYNSNNNNVRTNVQHNERNIGNLVETLMSAQDTEALLNGTIAKLQAEDVQSMQSTAGVTYDDGTAEIANDAYYDNIVSIGTKTPVTKGRSYFTTTTESKAAFYLKAQQDPNIKGKFVPGKEEYDNYVSLSTSQLQQKDAGFPPMKVRNMAPMESAQDVPDPDEKNQEEIKEKLESEDLLIPVKFKEEQHIVQGKVPKNKKMLRFKSITNKKPTVKSYLIENPDNMQAEVGGTLNVDSIDLTQIDDEFLNAIDITDSPTVEQPSLQLQYELGTGQHRHQISPYNARGSMRDFDKSDFTTKASPWSPTLMGVVDAEDKSDPIELKQVERRLKTRKRKLIPMSFDDFWR